MLYVMSFSVFLSSLNDFYNRTEADVANYDIIDVNGSLSPHNFTENRGGMWFAFQYANTLPFQAEDSSQMMDPRYG